MESEDKIKADPEAPFVVIESPRNATEALDGSNLKEGHHSDAAGDSSQHTTKPNKFKEINKVNPKSLHFQELYRFATPLDKLLLAVGVVMAGINGAMLPIMAIVFGNVITGFGNTPVDMDKVNSAALDYVYIAIGIFFSDYIAFVAFEVTAERQIKVLRSESLRHMLFLDISWYDTHDALQLSSRITGDTIKIKNGMGQKLGDVIKYTVQSIVGFAIGFSRGWDITLVMVCTVPVQTYALGWLVNSMRAKAKWSQKIYAEAGAIAEETLGSIRTVVSLTAEERAITKFASKTSEVESENIALHKVTAIVFGMFLGSVWIMNAVGLWYGGWKVSRGDTSPADVFSAFYAVLTSTGSLAQISPSVTAVSQAAGAADALFEILDTPSPIGTSMDKGTVPVACAGKIEAIDVNFSYPSRPDAAILRNYNLVIESGQTVAIAGASGGGKSTLIALLERFYDPTSGIILLDGRDIRTLNLKWLRSQIGLVSQEPVLFAATIFENIAFGCDGATREQVIKAAKLANAHNFIMSLPEGYDTLVVEKGISLSGGQKQRVAIARALVRNPTILILDEATSALDNESEKVVQAALNDLMGKTKVTTLLIAHRLSTIRHADKIVVLDNCHIVESGTHDELISIEEGIYRKMYMAQQLHDKGNDDGSDEANVAMPKLLQNTGVYPALRDSDATKVEDNSLILSSFGLFDFFSLSKPETKVLCFGLVGTVLTGFSMPASALLTSDIVSTMTTKFTEFQKTEDRSYLNNLYDDVQLYSILYFVGAVLIIFFMFIQSYSFKYVQEKLTSRLRNRNFEGLCRQNVGFFEEKENGTGSLTADLATNATKVALLSGDSQARLFQAIFTFVATLSISFGFGSWLLTLIMFAVTPLLIFGHIARRRYMYGIGAISDDLSIPGAHASEVLNNIRTVVSLGIEDKSADTFDELLRVPMQNSGKEAQINGISLGFSSSILMAVNALIFWYGAQKVNDGTMTFTEMLRTMMTSMTAIQVVSGASTYFGDTPKAYKAGATIEAICNRKVVIDAFDEAGLRPACLTGKIEFKDICFRYPTRPGVAVLKSFSLTIEPGQTVAFCGPSGGGKSTCIALLERFYDPVEGQILFDGIDAKQLNVRWLRSQLGFVGQEPTLFIGSIAENIAYGLKSTPSQEEIEAAAKMANAHDFISQFPDGYSTQVGAKGEQLSGGQKQRIAIARAILKNPNVLLLDEATSALDSESEKVVQEALDKVVAMRKRTIIIVAHRLATICNADKICVVSDAKIAEQGTHQELIAMKGIYFKLVNAIKD